MRARCARKYFRPAFEKSLVAQRLDELAGQRTPHADAAGAAGDVADLHRSVGGQLPVQVVEVELAVGADLEPVGAEPGDRPVAADAARLVEHEGVGDGADALVHLPGGQAVEQRQRTGAADLEAPERGHVVQRDRAPGCATPRPRRSASGTSRGPGVPRRRCPLGRQVGHQRGVGLVPVRALPAGALEEDRAELLLAGVERADPQVARRRSAAAAGAARRRSPRSSAPTVSST